jgi:hypothetical protein
LAAFNGCSRECGPFLSKVSRALHYDNRRLGSRHAGPQRIAVIWDFYLAAAAAKRKGRLDMAASLIEIAEAAERL